MPKVTSRRPRPVPQRTCVSCRATQAKRQLIRLVRTSHAGVRIDPTGKLAGRGAYLCHNRGCWDRALRTHRLNAALKTTLSGEEAAALREYAAALPDLGAEPDGPAGVGPDKQAEHS